MHRLKRLRLALYYPGNSSMRLLRHLLLVLYLLGNCSMRYSTSYIPVVVHGRPVSRPLRGLTVYLSSCMPRPVSRPVPGLTVYLQSCDTLPPVHALVQRRQPPEINQTLPHVISDWRLAAGAGDLACARR
jgi:hypothetical protein